MKYHTHKGRIGAHPTKKELLTITKENKHPQQVTRIDIILQIMKINKTPQTKTNADLTLYRTKCDY